jgi:hypothetical protein
MVLSSRTKTKKILPPRVNLGYTHGTVEQRETAWFLGQDIKKLESIELFIEDQAFSPSYNLSPYPPPPPIPSASCLSFSCVSLCRRRRSSLHRKKRFTGFPSPAGMSLTKLPLGRNNSIMTSLFPPRESLVATSRLGTGNSRTFFYGVLTGKGGAKSYNGENACSSINYSILSDHNYAHN